MKLGGWFASYYHSHIHHDLLIFKRVATHRSQIAHATRFHGAQIQVWQFSWRARIVRIDAFASSITDNDEVGGAPSQATRTNGRQNRTINRCIERILTQRSRTSQPCLLQGGLS